MDEQNFKAVEFNSLEFNLYELLNLPVTCTTEQVRKTFRRLIKKFHPDKITALEEKLYYNITLAHNILTNDEHRKKYDEWLLQSHKSHSTLKDNFRQELETVKEYFPKTKEEAGATFAKQFEELGKRHGNINIDSRSLNNIYKDKEKERNNISIPQENFVNMDEFNKRFSERKINGTYSNQLIKRTMDIQPFTFGSSRFAELKDFHSVYSRDSTIDYSFQLLPTGKTDFETKTISQRLEDYNNVTNSLKKNIHFGDLDI
jgi:curved DNA-binding protein CbpA